MSIEKGTVQVGGGMLPDHEIFKLCQTTRQVPLYPQLHPSPMSDVDQQPMIDPFNQEQVEPASYDVRLSNHFKIFERDHNTAVDFDDPIDITKDVFIEDDGYFTLHPGEFVLGATVEHVFIPDNIVARIEGKSSVGRLGILVHVTAGFIDPGYIGPITLEMASLHPLPIKLRPDMLIGQLSFQWTSSPVEKPYTGRYQGATTVESSRYGKDPIGQHLS
jgi:dCTP deaminase